MTELILFYVFYISLLDSWNILISQFANVNCLTLLLKILFLIKMRLRMVFELINDACKTLFLATSIIKKRQLVGITKSSSRSFYSCEIFQMTDNFSRRRSVRRFHAPKEEYSSRFFNVMFSVTPSFTIRQRIVINEPRKTRHRVLAFLF